MEIVARLAPLALERELLDRIDAAHPGSELRRTLVLVPTTRLVEHLQRRLAERRPAWLGLGVMDFSGLAREILRARHGSVPRVASDLLLESLLRRLGQAHPDNRWIAFTRTRPGALRTLHETLKDLREAGVEPRFLAGSAPDTGLAEIYERYHGALEDALDAGWTDRAGLAALAASHAVGFASGFRSIFVHGAYDWTGFNLDLLRALDRGREITIFLPAKRGTPVSRFAERFAEESLGGLEESGDGGSAVATGGGLRLDALFDEQSRPEPAPKGALCFAHAQGATAEVKLAVREALRAVAEGCPPAEIVLTARSLAPYAAALEEIFEDEGLNWSSSLAMPLRRVPLVREFLLLLKVLAEGFPRAATVAWIRSPLVDWSHLLGEGGAPPPAEFADLWSREAGLIGGVEDWTVALPRWAAVPKSHAGQSEEELERAREQAAKDAIEAERIARCVGACSQAVETGPRTWEAHARGLRAALRIVPGDPGNDDDLRASEALERLFDEMARLETWIGETGDVSFDRMREWLEQAADRNPIDLHPRDAGGIRVLDAMQMRGLTFRKVQLLGMNSGLFPRSPRQDPILDDEARLRVAQCSGQPLGRKLEAADEERLLLAMILGAASDGVRVSWQRADESGKSKTPSLALRELARLRYGRPDLGRLTGDARHLRSHPEQELRDLLASPGLLSSRDEMLLAILGSGGIAQGEALAERFESLVPGLAMLQATESWDFQGPEYDGRIGHGVAEPSLSVSAMETLGKCPLQHFFRRRLRVAEFPDEPSAVAIPDREVGTTIHDLLERIYGALRDEGLFEEERSVDLVERGLELLARGSEDLLGERGRRLARRLPVLWNEARRSWLQAVKTTVASDLGRAAAAQWKLLGVEEQRRELLDLGEEFRFQLSARFDRRFQGTDGTVVGDYKTARKLKDRVNPTNMLKGQQLQVPLYRMLAGEDSSVELIGIHPDFQEADPRVAFGGFESDAQAESFRDTLRVLLSLSRNGVYPLREGYHCQWCPFTAACRRRHPPTLDREARSTDAAPFRDLSRKTKGKPNG